MPITLVTGLPGHGKTLYSLARYKDEAEKAGRPVFHNNIPGLNIAGWQVWDAAKWQDLPPNALMIIDEAWKDFPVRGRGEPPPHVGELARHRHLGVDFVLITQDPMLLDNFVRRLVDRHFHIARKFGTHWATIYEFTAGARDNVKTNRKDAVRHEWRYPKHVFEWYRSAEVHTVKARIPARVWLFLSLFIILPVLVYFTYQYVKPSTVSEQMMRNVKNADGSTPGSGQVSQAQTNSTRRNEMMTPAEYAAAYQARITGLPHTAPIYDEVTRPTEAPYPAACISMPAKHRCSCYTQQGTKLDTGKDLCEQIAAGGFFVAWRQQVAQAVPVSPQPQPGQAQAVPAMAAGFGYAPGQGQIADAGQVEQDPARPRVRR